MKQSIENLITAAVENLDTGLLDEAYEDFLEALDDNMITKGQQSTYEYMFESAREMIEELI